jgi:hypothetical protein
MISFPKKNYFTHEDLPKDVPKGKILHHVSVIPTDDPYLLKSVRDALEKSVKEKLFQTHIYNDSPLLDKDLSKIKVINVEVAKKFNNNGVLELYLTLNKALPKDKNLSEIRHNLNVEAFMDGSIDASIDFSFLFGKNSRLVFNFK